MIKDKKDFTSLAMFLASYAVRFIFSDKYRNFAEILFFSFYHNRFNLFL